MGINVLFFCCGLNYAAHIQWLKTTPADNLRVLLVRSTVVSAGSSADDLHKLGTQRWSHKALGKNLLAGSFWLLVELLSSSWFPCGPFHLQGSTHGLNPSHALNLYEFPLSCICLTCFFPLGKEVYVIMLQGKEWRKMTLVLFSHRSSTPIRQWTNQDFCKAFCNSSQEGDSKRGRLQKLKVVFLKHSFDEQNIRCQSKAQDKTCQRIRTVAPLSLLQGKQEI